MKLSDLNIIKHPDFAADEAWIITKEDAPQVPHDLRGTLPGPCILTGDVEQAKRMVTFLQAVAVLETSDSFTPRTASKTVLLGDSHPLASLQRALYQ
jgi:hypothetical protein